MDENKIETILNKLAEHGYKTRDKTTELEKHKIFGLIHNAQNNKFEKMYIDTIVLDEYDNVIKNDKG